MTDATNPLDDAGGFLELRIVDPVKIDADALKAKLLSPAPDTPEERDALREETDVTMLTMTALSWLDEQIALGHDIECLLCDRICWSQQFTTRLARLVITTKESEVRRAEGSNAMTIGCVCERCARKPDTLQARVVSKLQKKYPSMRAYPVSTIAPSTNTRN